MALSTSSRTACNMKMISVKPARTYPSTRPAASSSPPGLVQLTPDGLHSLREGRRAVEDAEREFLAPLEPAEAAQFRETLQRLVRPEPPTD